jgi:hypothetical protein
VAIVSMKTVPVNQSLGPTPVSVEFLVICIGQIPILASSSSG